jgi:CDP-diacylglycerol---glycerol-3-phosphate 3-phosphatidyltransferase
MKFPTQLTVLRIVLAPLFYTFFIVDPPQYLWAAIVFVVAAVTDWYDGYFARKWKLVSRFGSFLDPLADKILTSIAFIAFAAVGLIPVWTVIVIIGRDMIMTILRVVADLNDISVRTSIVAKVKTFVQMSFIALILLMLIGTQGTFGTAFREFAKTPLIMDISFWGILLIVVLTVVTFLQYVYDNAQLIRMAVSKYILRRITQHP